MHRGPIGPPKKTYWIRHSTGSSARLSGSFVPVMACSCWVHGVSSGGILASPYTAFQGLTMMVMIISLGARCLFPSELHHILLCGMDWPASLCGSTDED